MKKPTQFEDIVIIGAGPAGIASAIQLKRYGFDPLIFEEDRIGGLLHNANLVENYPGFPDGISGPNLVELMKDHLISLEPRFRRESIVKVDYNGDTFILRTSNESSHPAIHAKFIIVATGTHPRPFPQDLHIPDDCKAQVLSEVKTIIGAKNKKIVIVGAGDAAFDYALNLGKENEVIILNRLADRKCLPLLFRRSHEMSSISYYENSRVLHIRQADSDLEISIEKGGVLVSLTAHYLIYAIGRDPADGIITPRLRGQLERLEEEGLLYLIGDVKNGRFRQVSIAVGDGVRAAMRISTILPEKPE